MVRLSKEHRKAQVFAAAEKLAKECSLYDERFNYDSIAHQCDCSRNTVRHHFGSLIELRNLLIEHSFQGDRILFQQALICNDPAASRLQNGSQQTERI